LSRGLALWRVAAANSLHTAKITAILKKFDPFWPVLTRVGPEFRKPSMALQIFRWCRRNSEPDFA
jgi:hypothetical protein